MTTQHRAADISCAQTSSPPHLPDSGAGDVDTKTVVELAQVEGTTGQTIKGLTGRQLNRRAPCAAFQLVGGAHPHTLAPHPSPLGFSPAFTGLLLRRASDCNVQTKRLTKRPGEGLAAKQQRQRPPAGAPLKGYGTPHPTLHCKHWAANRKPVAHCAVPSTAADQPVASPPIMSSLVPLAELHEPISEICKLMTVHHSRLVGAHDLVEELNHLAER